MSRGPLRRAIVFVDYSGLRETLRQNVWITGTHGPRADIDFEKLGRLLCGPEREFIRTILYSSVPVAVEELSDGFVMNGVPVHEHEAHRARLVERGYEDLVHRVETGLAFTELVSGRMVLRRVELRHGPAFEWARNVLEGARGEGTTAEEEASFFEDAVQANSQAKEARVALFERIKALKDEGAIPHQLMSSYTSFMSDLLDQKLDFTEKGTDTRLTVQMLELCMNDAFDDAILFAADEDYVPLVEAVKRTGRRVIHAFWDIPNFGFRLRGVCDDSVLVGRNGFGEIV